MNYQYFNLNLRLISFRFKEGLASLMDGNSLHQTSSNNNQKIICNEKKKNGLHVQKKKSKSSNLIKGNYSKDVIDLYKMNTRKFMNVKINQKSCDFLSHYVNSYSKSKKKIIKKSRIPFTKEEDEQIVKLTEKYGTKQWSLIASHVNGRTPKQCRDRYSNYLVPGFFKCEWTNEEDELLINLYKQIGPKWSILQKSFPRRSSSSIKNRWKYFLCKQNHTLNHIYINSINHQKTNDEKPTTIKKEDSNNKKSNIIPSANDSKNSDNQKKDGLKIDLSDFKICENENDDFIDSDEEWNYYM